MIIYNDTFEQYMDSIASLVQRGLTFAADSGSLSIKLTGGY
jgi:hypothetical protein